MMKKLIPLIFLTAVLVGCGTGPETGPGEVHWDRDVCARCIMAVSDHNYSAQIRGGAEGRSTKLYFFDDIGCAVRWIDEQPWKDDSRTEIWVTDWHNGSWIDATKAWYVTGKNTPMDFGLGAQFDSEDSALSYEQAVDHVFNRGQMAH
jgi:copper chaperone NosL